MPFEGYAGTVEAGIEVINVRCRQLRHIGTQIKDDEVAVVYALAIHEAGGRKEVISSSYRLTVGVSLDVTAAIADRCLWPETLGRRSSSPRGGGRGRARALPFLSAPGRAEMQWSVGLQAVGCARGRRRQRESPRAGELHRRQAAHTLVRHRGLDAAPGDGLGAAAADVASWAQAPASRGGRAGGGEERGDCGDL